MSEFKTSRIFSGLKKALDTNAPTLATFGSIVGLGLTVYFMHKASKSAAKVETSYEETVEEIKNSGMTEEGEKEEITREKMNKYMRLVYIYRWALLSGVASAGFAVLSNYLNGRTIATITGLLALNQEKLKEYAKKGKEMLGDEKFKELQDNVEQELFAKKVEKGELKVDKAAPKIGKEEDGPDPGYERYYVPFWGEIYDIPSGRLKDAIAEAERLEYLNYNDWRGMLGLDSCGAGYKFCWSQGNPFKAHIGYVNMGVGGMKAICYDNEPDFDKFGK